MKIEDNVLIQVDEEDLDNKLGFVVPEGIQKIACFAFVSCKQIKTVVLPQSVVAIGVSAFDGCSNLECVHLSDQIRIIGMHAFRCCRKLNQIHLPDKLETLCEGAFTDTGITEITVPDSVVRMDDFIFAYCHKLEKAKLPRNLEIFGERLFYDCRTLAQVSLPETLLGLPAYTFLNCRKLETVSIPASVRKIGRGAFNGCSHLKEIMLPDGIKVIERHTFHGCERLLHVSIPDSVEQIETGAFIYCKSIKHMELPDSLSNIGNYAFAGCKSLKEIRIPDTVNELKKELFEDCESLQKITWKKKEYSIRCIDGDCVYVLQEKWFKECTLLKCAYFPEGEQLYAAEKDGCIAHGKTIRESVDTLNRRLTYKPSMMMQISKISKQEYVTANDYMILTGACKEGVERFLTEHSLTWEDTLSAEEVFELTKGQYGHLLFEKVMERIQSFMVPTSR